MAKLTQDEIKEINDLYLRIGTYNGVAKRLGRSAATVKKYIIEDYVPEEEIEKEPFDKEKLKEPSFDKFKVQEWTDFMYLSDEETEDLKQFVKEISV